MVHNETVCKIDSWILSFQEFLSIIAEIRAAKYIFLNRILTIYNPVDNATIRQFLKIRLAGQLLGNEQDASLPKNWPAILWNERDPCGFPSAVQSFVCARLPQFELRKRDMAIVSPAMCEQLIHGDRLGFFAHLSVK